MVKRRKNIGFLPNGQITVFDQLVPGKRRVIYLVVTIQQRIKFIIHVNETLKKKVHLVELCYPPLAKPNHFTPCSWYRTILDKLPHTSIVRKMKDQVTFRHKIEMILLITITVVKDATRTVSSVKSSKERL